MKRTAGFSLMELLVAMAVFSVLVGLAYGSVSLLMESDRSNRERQAALQQLQRAVLFLERDCYQVVGRAENAGYGESRPALYVPGDALLELTRGGNPDLGWELRPAAQMRSTLQRVRYVEEDGKLLRQSWNMVDHAENAEPLSQVLLEGVRSVKIRFLGDGATWSSDWEGKTLPRAIEWVLVHENFGEIKRIFVVYL